MSATERDREAEADAKAPVITLPPVRHTGTPLQWARAPQQARSARTLARLLDAAEGILLEKGLDAVTVPAVIERAGSSVGAFYARFEDKRALLEAVHERACVRTLEQADEILSSPALRTVPLWALVRAGVGLGAQVADRRRNVMGAFAQTLGADPGFAARREQTLRGLSERITRVLSERGDVVRSRDLGRAIDLSMRVITATLEQHSGFEASPSGHTLSRAALYRELESMIAAYLGVEMPADDASHEAEEPASAAPLSPAVSRERGEPSREGRAAKAPRRREGKAGARTKPESSARPARSRR